MSGTTTGIAPGFGGFAVSPDGQAQYDARAHNPYAFLQQGVPQGTAPAAASMMSQGGLVGVNPQQELQWARFLKMRGNGGAFRNGGRVWQRLDDGGDAGGDGGDDSGQGGDQGADQGSDDAGLGAAGGTNGPFGGADAPGNSPEDAAGATDPSMAQAALAGIKAGLPGMVASAVPGLGPVMGIANALGLGKGISSALGVGAMSPGAQFGSTLGGLVGSMGGPVGAMAGAALGGYAGAHGGSGPGMGGMGANAGTNGIGSAVAGQGGNPSGPTSNAGSVSNMGESSDIGSLIQRIHGAMQNGTVQPSQGLAAGGMAMGAPSMGLGAAAPMSGPPPGFGGGLAPAGAPPSMGAMPNHNFHAGSGLIHGASDGRADALHTHVPRGGYVVPADVVSGLGQGNTMSGAKKLKGLMPSHTPRFAAGGSVPVRLSSGEFFVHPAHVAALGNGNLKAGSDKLDTMVGHVRRINARQVAGMPPPR